jgi:hypothetical protein
VETRLLVVGGRGSLVIAPRQLDHEALGPGAVGDVLERVAHLGELSDSAIEGACDLVLLEDGAVEVLLGLVPEAVQQRRVGEALDVLDEVLVVEHDVLVVEPAVANVLEGRGNLVKDHVVVGVSGLGEADLELGLAIRLLLLAERVLVFAGGGILGLDLAKLSSGNHRVRWCSKRGCV